MLSPTSSFLCCLPLRGCVKAILWLNLAQSVLCCAMALANLMMDSPDYAYATSGAAQVSSAAWSLLGVPVIAVGLWGIENNVEPHLRLYLYYLFASCLIDTWYLVEVFILRDACVSLEHVDKSGEAFACGVARAVSLTGMICAVAAMVYIVYAVWSFCQDLADGGSSTAIAALLRQATGLSATAGKDELLPWTSTFAGPEAGYDSVAPFASQGRFIGQNAGYM